MSKFFIERNYKVATGAFTYDMSAPNNFKVARLDINIDAAPTTAGNIVISKINTTTGSDYDTEIRVVDSVGTINLSIEDIPGFSKDDAVRVVFANADNNAVSLSATLETTLESTLKANLLEK